MFPGGFGDGFADGFPDADQDAGFGGGEAFGDVDFGGEDFGLGGLSSDGGKRKKKRDKRRRQKDAGSDGDLGFTEGADFGGAAASSSSWLGASAPETGDGGVLEGGLAYLGAVLGADCQISHQIQTEVDRMDDELRDLSQQCSQMHEEVLSATAEHALLTAQQKSYETQLRDERRRHAHLHSDRRAMNLEQVGAAGERFLCLDELQFLQEQEAQDEQELVEMKRLNASIQAEIATTEARNAPLEARRRDALQDVVAERRRLKEDLQALRDAREEHDRLDYLVQKERTRQERDHLRSAYRHAERALREAEDDLPRASLGEPGAGAEAPPRLTEFDKAFGSTEVPPRLTQFDQVFEGRTPVHIRRHLAAGRPNADPLDI